MTQPTSRTGTPYTACILYGFCEGPRLAKRLRRACAAAGWQVVHNPAQADVILAHSAGCFFIPPDHRARQLLLIDPPYWPGRSIAAAVLRKVWNDAHASRRRTSLVHWLVELSWNALYFWNLPQGIRMLRRRHNGAAWRVTAPSLTLVRNQHDVFLRPDLAGIPFVQQPTVVRLPGDHDDCYRNPQAYLDLLQSKQIRSGDAIGSNHSKIEPTLSAAG